MQEDVQRIEKLKNRILIKNTLQELKNNWKKTASTTDRHDVIKLIVRCMNEDALDFQAAKDVIFKKMQISVHNKANYNLTDDRSMYNDFEYDELTGHTVYGWDAYNNEAVYEPTFGVSKTPPLYKDAGKKWKDTLKHRWDKLKSKNKPDLNDYDGNNDDDSDDE